MRNHLALAAGVGLLLMTGCSAEATPGDQPSLLAEVSMSPEQEAAVADNVATQEEYRQGFDRYSECLAESGITVEVIGEENQVIDYRVPAADGDPGDNRCYEYEFANLDMLWQVSQQDTSKDAARLRECIREAGVEPAESWEQLVVQAEENQVSLRDCLASEG